MNKIILVLILLTILSCNNKPEKITNIHTIDSNRILGGTSFKDLVNREKYIAKQFSKMTNKQLIIQQQPIKIKVKVLKRLNNLNLFLQNQIMDSIIVEFNNVTDSTIKFWYYDIQDSWVANWVYSSDKIKIYNDIKGCCDHVFGGQFEFKPNIRYKQPETIRAFGKWDEIKNIEFYIGFVLIRRDEADFDDMFSNYSWVKYKKMKYPKNILWSEPFKFK